MTFDVREAGLGFAFDEALALHLAGRSLTLFAGTCLGDAAQRALQKVRSGFTSKTLDYLEQLRPLWHQSTPKPSGYADKADVLDALLAGLEDRKATFIRQRVANDDAAQVFRDDAAIHQHGPAAQETDR